MPGTRGVVLGLLLLTAFSGAIAREPIVVDLYIQATESILATFDGRQTYRNLLTSLDAVLQDDDQVSLRLFTDRVIPLVPQQSYTAQCRQALQGVLSPSTVRFTSLMRLSPTLTDLLEREPGLRTLAIWLTDSEIDTGSATGNMQEVVRIDLLGERVTEQRADTVFIDIGLDTEAPAIASAIDADLLQDSQVTPGYLDDQVQQLLQEAQPQPSARQDAFARSRGWIIVLVFGVLVVVGALIFLLRALERRRHPV